MNKLVVALLMFPMIAMGQDAPYECDNNYGECGTPEMSGGGQGGGGSILINNTDLGDTYQSADDYDDDGVEDSYDNCPRVRNSEQFDSDGDDIGDLCDNCRSTHNQNQWDLDGDGKGDLCDSDLDNDGILNEDDNCLRRHNQTQSDLDNDGEGDACDYDLDGDGIDNLQDSCPTIAGEIVDSPISSSQCFPDRDGDNIPDFGSDADNCLGIYNPQQTDTDLDGAGDRCDPDLDNDSVLNLRDNCVDIFNIDQKDADRDGRGDHGCDDHYCFVVFGDEENCLDPEAEFKVYSPNVSLSTGVPLKLRLFMNRSHQPAHYAWSIKERPIGSNATISEPIGNTLESSIFEYILEKHPVFVPDEPGRYVLQINVETLFEDVQTHMVESVDLHEVELIVTGPSLNRSAGCNVTADQGNISLLLMLAGYLGIRRRK